MKTLYNIEKTNEYLEKFGVKEYFDPALMEKLYISFYEPDEYILMSGQEGHDILFLVDGIAMATSYTENGEELIVCLSRAFEVLGDVELALKNKIYNNVQAKTKCTLLALPRRHMGKELNSNAPFYRLISKMLAEKLIKTSEKYKLNVLYSLKYRVGKFFEELQDDTEILTILQYKDIAKILGVTDRQLRRVLGGFEKNGIIERTRNGIKIIDTTRLEKYNEMMKE